MAAKISTGLRNHMLATGSLKAALDGGVIYIYSGTPPATADAALSGNTLLCTISNNAAGTGITMSSTPNAGVLGKASAETWRGQIVANGTATFFRFATLVDDGTLSTTATRLQGTVGTVGADLNFSTIAFVSGDYKNVDTFNVALPTI